MILKSNNTPVYFSEAIFTWRWKNVKLLPRQEEKREGKKEKEAAITAAAAPPPFYGKSVCVFTEI